MKSEQKGGAMRSEEYPVDREPGRFDVLLGRGRGNQQRSGNRRYQTLLAMFSEQYYKASQVSEKAEVTRNIVLALHQTGRFMRYNKQLESWVVLTENGARERVNQALMYRKRQWQKDQTEVMEEVARGVALTPSSNSDTRQGEDRSSTADRSILKPAARKAAACSVMQKSLQQVYKPSEQQHGLFETSQGAIESSMSTRHEMSVLEPRPLPFDTAVSNYTPFATKSDAGSVIVSRTASSTLNIAEYIVEIPHVTELLLQQRNMDIIQQKGQPPIHR